MKLNARDIIGLAIILGLCAGWSFDRWRLTARMNSAEGVEMTAKEQADALHAQAAARQQKLAAAQAETAAQLRAHRIPANPSLNADPEAADDLLGGAEVTLKIRGAKTVEVFRLKDQRIAKNLADYEIADGPHEIDAITAADLADAVTASSTYLRDAAVGCIPTLGVRTRFTDGTSTVDIVYCFECSILVVYLNEKPVGSGYFGPGSKYLIRLVKRMLPNDEAIQKLQ